MAFDGLNAAMLIENVQVPQLALPADVVEGMSQTNDQLGLRAQSAGTLIEALQAVTRNEAGDPAHRGNVFERHNVLEADLWLSRSGHAGHSERQISIGDPAIANTDPADDDPARSKINSTPPAADPLRTKPLTRAEIGHAISRQFDSTDWGWEEMSTGDYEWAMHNFHDDVEAAVERAVVDATSDEDAIQRAQEYLNSVGLGNIVHVGGSVTGDENRVIITGNRDQYTPTAYMPTLSMDYWDFANVNTQDVYQAMDEASVDINLRVDGPLTPEQNHALEILRQQIANTTAMLNALPANGVFTFPDGKSISVAELRALWARADFLVTSQPTNSGGTPTLPGLSYAHRNNGDPLIEVNINNLAYLMTVSPSHALTFILHELAHVTLAGHQLNNGGLPDGMTPDQFHLLNEGFADRIAAAIVSLTGGQLSSGYLLSREPWTSLWAEPTLSVPTPGGGGTGGGSGGDGGDGGGDGGGYIGG